MTPPPRDASSALGSDLPLTVRAGDAAVKLTLSALRRRWRYLAAIVAAFTVFGALAGNVWGGLFVGGLLLGLLLIVIAVALVAQWRHRTATICVTATDLLVKGRRLPRADFGEMVLGFFTNLPTEPAALQACFTTREGRRFATVQLAWWPADGLDEVAAALGTTPRLAEGGSEVRLLQPWWVRHWFATIATGTVVGIAVIVGVIMIGDYVIGSRARAAAADAEEAWPAYAAEHLTVQEVPGLVSADVQVSPDDDDRSQLDVRTELSIETSDGQLSPAAFSKANAAVCGFHSELDGRKTSFRNVIYVSRPRVSDSAARLDVGCGDVEPVRAWLTYLSDHPLGSAVDRADASYAQGLLSVWLFMASPSADAFATTAERTCGFRHDGTELAVGAMLSVQAAGSADGPYLSDVGCDDVAEARQQWVQQSGGAR